MGSLSSSPDVIKAQFRSFAKKMPAYYASVVAMMIAVVYVYGSIAPVWLAIVVPVVISGMATVRGIWWIYHRNDSLTCDEAAAYLKKATWTLVVSAVVVVSMDVKLFHYGNDFTRNYLLVQMVVSAMCGFYCLMHLRKAALLVFAAVMVPFDALTLALHQPTANIGAITVTLTAAVMIIAMRGYQKDFLNLVHAEAETQKLSKENLRLAHLDTLTGLPNRRHFFESLRDWTPGFDSPLSTAAIGILDLDGFKPVNDTYGHAVGDTVLTEIAARLERLSGNVLHLCRLGGDEFAFLVEAQNEQSLLSIGQAMIDAVSHPIQAASRVTSVGCSVGFAPWPRDTNITGDALYERADYALYHAKRTGRGKTVLFSEEHERLIREQGVIEQALRGANLKEEFYLMYQPIVELSTGAPLCFEALARWNSPLLGEVSPAAFIPIAERTGLITELTLVLLGKALHDAAMWPDAVGLSVNVSPHDISSYAQTQKIISAILASDVAPTRLTIELIETALLNTFTETAAHMEMLRSIGVSLALDDFGTGHSSLSYVHALPLDKIKIDRSFVQDLNGNSASQKVVKSVISLCRDLSVASVVEGVETDSQLKLLNHLGAAHIQGYLFSKPMLQENALAYIEEHSPVDMRLSPPSGFCSERGEQDSTQLTATPNHPLELAEC